VPSVPMRGCGSGLDRQDDRGRRPADGIAASHMIGTETILPVSRSAYRAAGERDRVVRSKSTWPNPGIREQPHRLAAHPFTGAKNPPGEPAGYLVYALRSGRGRTSVTTGALAGSGVLNTLSAMGMGQILARG